MRSDKRNIFSNKDDFRVYCLKKIKYTSKNYKLKNESIVLNELKKVLKKLSPKTMLWYIPLKTEVNTLKIISYFRRNSTILVPFMEGVSFKVVKFRLPLIKKRFSIREPQNSFAKVSCIDVMIVPVVGVDGNLRRIGFGKGMYDRFFESLKRRPLVIFVQLCECCTKSLIGKSHDIQADIYITPKKTLIKRGNNDNRNGHSRRSRCT